MKEDRTPLQQLQDVIETLCSPEGCEWDRAQTPESLCDYILEEAHELVDAIRHGSASDVREELGDVFFLLHFISSHYANKGDFTLDDSLKHSAAKMIHRHPHVFSGVTFSNLDEQLAAWEVLKRSEKAEDADHPYGVFNSLPRNLPALLKAYRIHSKAARAGFTWEKDADVEQQVEAEWLELLDAFAHGESEAKAHELGDILFTIVELGRRKGIKASDALDHATERFLSRFTFMEEKARSAGKDFMSLSMEEKNALWEQAKNGVSHG